MAGNRIGVVAGVGQVEIITVANPGAQTNWIYTIADNVIVRPIAVAFDLATDANVAARRVRLYLDDGAQNLAVSISGATQVAGNSYQYASVHNTDYSALIFNSNVMMQLPDIFLLQGCRIQSSIAAFQVGDAMTNIRLILQTFKGV